MVLIYSSPVKNWKCVFKECKAACCTANKVITAGDVKRISKALGIAPQEFVNLTDERGVFKLKGKNNACVFVGKNFACALHKKGVKPIFCRMYPFEFDGVIYADELVLKIKPIKNCPGFGKGRKVGEKFEANIEELANEFVREIKDFLKLKQQGLSTEEIIEKGD